MRQEQSTDGSVLVTHPDGALLILESKLAEGAVLCQPRSVNYNESPPPPKGGNPRGLHDPGGSVCSGQRALWRPLLQRKPANFSRWRTSRNSVLFRPRQPHRFVLIVGDARAAKVGGRKRFVRKDAVAGVKDGSCHLSW